MISLEITSKVLRNYLGTPSFESFLKSLTFAKRGFMLLFYIYVLAYWLNFN